MNTLTYTKKLTQMAFGMLLALAPAIVGAQELDPYAPAGDSTSATIMVLVGIIIFSAVLARIWMGNTYFSAPDEEVFSENDKSRGLSSSSLHIVIGTVACTAAMFLLSLKVMGGIAPFDGPTATTRAAVFFGFLGLVSVVAQFIWARAKHYVFAVTVGTVATFILMGFQRMLFDGGEQDPFIMAMGITCVVLSWRFLFGPWRPVVKSTVLGTFIFWVGLQLFLGESPDERTARILATIIAFIPAVIWCMLFLRDHVQRLSLVILMFFAGILSTAPILFYDKMVRSHTELNFFLFRIVPENFTNSSNAFVAGNIASASGLKSTLVVTLVSFLIVGLIEEVSKFWVLKKSGQQFFSSIDDVLQLGIIVAIGFAFSENIMNPTYFMNFVREYLIGSDTPQWGAFMGNVLGRAILTNMVHILSTGVFAYFYGLALFAEPYLEDDKVVGNRHPIAEIFHVILRFPRKLVFRRRVMIQGLLSAVFLHGFFNFLVTLPDLLPGNPRTVGDIFNAPPESFLHYIALLIIPSMFYVVGGFWILSILFYRKECMKERGCLMTRDTFVSKDKLMA